MNKTQLYIFGILSHFFSVQRLWTKGVLVAEYDVMLSGIQMRRPDVAYLSDEQIELIKKGEDVIPEFLIEIISGNDNINKVEEKIVEYYKAGVKVVWLILPDSKAVHVYTSRKSVQICTDADICSANPVLPNFEISVDEIFA